MAAVIIDHNKQFINTPIILADERWIGINIRGFDNIKVVSNYPYAIKVNDSFYVELMTEQMETLLDDPYIDKNLPLSYYLCCFKLCDKKNIKLLSYGMHFDLNFIMAEFGGIYFDDIDTYKVNKHQPKIKAYLTKSHFDIAKYRRELNKYRGSTSIIKRILEVNSNEVVNEVDKKDNYNISTLKIYRAMKQHGFIADGNNNNIGSIREMSGINRNEILRGFLDPLVYTSGSIWMAHNEKYMGDDKERDKLSFRLRKLFSIEYGLMKHILKPDFDILRSIKNRLIASLVPFIDYQTTIDKGANPLDDDDYEKDDEKDDGKNKENSALENKHSNFESTKPTLNKNVKENLSDLEDDLDDDLDYDLDDLGYINNKKLDMGDIKNDQSDLEDDLEDVKDENEEDRNEKNNVYKIVHKSESDDSEFDSDSDSD